MRRSIPVVAAFLALSLVPLGGCASKTRRHDPQMDVQDRTALGDWSHFTQVTARGSKSEGRHGHLHFKGRGFAPCFDRLVTPLGTFRYVVSRVLWGDHAWTREGAETPATAATNGTALGKAALDKGWVESKERLSGTPDAWVRAERDGKAWWVDPARFKDLRQAAGLSPIRVWEWE